MDLYVVRHAHAGNRSAWDGVDAARPLSKKGRRQADGIADRLGGAGIAQLISSPARRCVETLEPLAERLGLAVEGDSRLSEGARVEDALALAAELNGNGNGATAVAVCTHGDVIPELLHALRAHATRFADPLVWPKGSTWVLTGEAGRFATARYVPPPAV